MGLQAPDLTGMEPVQKAAPTPPAAPPVIPDDPVWNPLQRSSLPTILNTAPDQLRQFYNKQSGPQSRVLPQNPAALTSHNSAASSQSIVVQQSGLALTLQSNNVKNPVQNILNLIAGNGISLVANNAGGVTISGGGSGGDGLTHGRTVWWGDPGVFWMYEDFARAGTTNVATFPTQNIGTYGWQLAGGIGIYGGVFGGTPPYFGQMSWCNNPSATQAGVLILPAANQAFDGGANPGSWALAENPGAVFTWIFKFDVTPTFSSSTPANSFAQKSFYLGLAGPVDVANAGSSLSSRPSTFIGLRYDTSTTSPSINDSFYTLEVVTNGIPNNNYTRNNTQGTTLVTNVAPAVGVWHRLDIFFSAVGTVTITLDGSAINTLTATIPTLSFTTTASSQDQQLDSNRAYLNWNIGGGSPNLLGQWGAGSVVDVSGLTGSAAVFNGAATLLAGQVGSIQWNLVGANVLVFNQTPTLTGYSQYSPFALMGNDDDASPTANTASVFIDLFSGVWNPNLGPSAPGTPDPTKPRYF
jgi:hypothetical protein